MSLPRQNTYHSTISHIYSPEDRPFKWKKNDDDPYIYISFSYNQFKTVFTKLFRNINQQEIENSQFKSLDTEVINELTIIARREWLERAKLPIKFLSDNAPDIMDKNVYFIFTDLSMDSESALTSVSSHPLFSRMVFSRFRDIKIDNLTPKDIYMFLHEGMHAILGAKHFRPYDPDDYLPFTSAKPGKSEFDCSRTVLAYEEDCAQVMDHLITSHVYDDAGEFLYSTDIPNPFNYPITLGELDLEAARLFNIEWNGQPLQPISTLPLKEWSNKEFLFQSLRSSTASILLKIKNTATDCADHLEAASKAYATDLVSSCPSYFPPKQSVAHLGYWSQPSVSLPQSLAAGTSSTIPRLGYSQPLFLAK